MSVIFHHIADADADADAYSVDLFSGIKFWLARKIPERKQLIDLLKDNGGVVVPQEKDADLLLVDGESRVGVPEGACSFMWVDACLDEGKLVDVDPFIIESASAPTKSTRTRFTTEDDRLLVEFVRNSDKASRGNKLFQQLAEEYSHHTWHSWRDRYGRIKDLPQYTNAPRETAEPSAAALDTPNTPQPRQPSSSRTSKRPGSTNGLVQKAPSSTNQASTSTRNESPRLPISLKRDHGSPAHPPPKRQNLGPTAKAPGSSQHQPILSRKGTSPIHNPDAVLPSQQGPKPAANSTPTPLSSPSIPTNTSPVTKRGKPSGSQPTVPNTQPGETVRATSSDDDNEERINAWFHECRCNGYSPKITSLALFHTTMVPGRLAYIVMDRLRQGNCIPSNHQGIWTSNDDHALKRVSKVNLSVLPTNSKQWIQTKGELDRLLFKHGEYGVQLRKEFLEALNSILSGQEDSCDLE